MQRRNLGPGGTFVTRLLRPPDMKAAQSMFERASDYFVLATGAPPAPDEATRAFVAGPPTKSVDDKRIIGIFDGRDELVGMLDALIDFPANGDWTMGMLLLDPAHRNGGLGSAVLAAYEEWASDEGAKRLHTAVVSHHRRGVRFLESRGYQPQREVSNYDSGSRKATIAFFIKDQPSPAES